MKIRFYIVIIFYICILPILSGQEKDIHVTNINTQGDSVITQIHDLKAMVDSLTLRDSLKAQSPNTDTTDVQELGYKLSNDALENDVKFDARDSSWVDVEKKKIYLYGGAKVESQGIKISASYMETDFGNNLIRGFDRKDSFYLKEPKPIFSQGENTFNFRSMTFNYKTKKGFVEHAATKQADFYIIGEKTKFIAGKTDSLDVKEDDKIYEQYATITTCNHDPPHWGIKASKLKFIPDKVGVLSLAHVEIADVPTPLFLPFAFFPLIKGKSSGLIFPSSYEYNEQLGLGFREVGYYFPISDYMDLRITGDIYTRGTWGVRVNTNYKKRYGYSGNILLGFANTISESTADGSRRSSQSYTINISHSQDPKAHPYRKLGGTIKLQSNRYDQKVYENPNAALTNTYASNFSFSHSMPGTPFNFSAEFRHSQNTQTRIMDVTFPNLSLRMNTIYPFKPKNVTKEKWPHKIALSYSSEFKNFVKTTDTTLFTVQTLKDMQTGLQQKAAINTNIRVLKYFNVTPSINYAETWLTKRYKLSFDPDSIRIDTLTGDTLGFKPPQASYEQKFTAFHDFNSSLSINTQLFGTIKGGSGFFRGLRHTAKPSVSFVYRPENKSRYEAIVNTDTREEYNQPRTYSTLTNSPFGTLTGTQQQMALSYSITNIIEAKYFTKKDTTEKKVRLFDNISINGNYNFAADSFQWSPINIRGNTSVLKGLTNFTFAAMFSPYVYDSNNKVTKQTVWEAGKILPEFRRLSGQFSTNISFGQIRRIFIGESEKSSKDQSANSQGSSTDIKETSLAGWFENFTFSHYLNFEFTRLSTRDTFYVSNHSISFAGSIPLTKNWNMNIGNIAYDLKNKSFVYPYFSFSRDLHCWQMNFTWAPSNGVYSFFIGVKSSALSFLKYDYQQRNPNTLFTGQR